MLIPKEQMSSTNASQKQFVSLLQEIFAVLTTQSSNIVL